MRGFFVNKFCRKKINCYICSGILKRKIMEELTNTKLDSLMEEFMKENPMGDSRELARFMYEKGWFDAKEYYY